MPAWLHSVNQQRGLSLWAPLFWRVEFKADWTSPWGEQKSDSWKHSHTWVVSKGCPQTSSPWTESDAGLLAHWHQRLMMDVSCPGASGRLKQGPGKPGSPMQEIWMQKGWVQAHSHALWSKQSLVTRQVVAGPAAFGVRVLYISDLLLMLTWLRIWENASTLMVKKQHTVIPRPSVAEVFKDRAKWGGTGQKRAFLFAVHCISPGIQGVHLYSTAFVPK